MTTPAEPAMSPEEIVANECSTECSGPEHLFHVRSWLVGNPRTAKEVRRVLLLPPDQRINPAIANAAREYFQRHPDALLPTPPRVSPAPTPEPEPEGPSL
jgi:hypothetical protein